MGNRRKIDKPDKRRALAFAALNDLSLDSPTTLLLLTIARLLPYETAECRIAIPTLSKYTRLSERTIKRKLRLLIDWNPLHIEESKGGRSHSFRANVTREEINESYRQHLQAKAAQDNSDRVIRSGNDSSDTSSPLVETNSDSVSYNGDSVSGNGDNMSWEQCHHDTHTQSYSHSSSQGGDTNSATESEIHIDSEIPQPQLEDIQFDSLGMITFINGTNIYFRKICRDRDIPFNLFLDKASIQVKPGQSWEQMKTGFKKALQYANSDKNDSKPNRKNSANEGNLDWWISETFLSLTEERKDFYRHANLKAYPLQHGRHWWPELGPAPGAENSAYPVEFAKENGLQEWIEGS